MDISKVKEGANLNYQTSRGKTGRGKVLRIEDTGKGQGKGVYVVLKDKETGAEIRLRAGSLSK